MHKQQKTLEGDVIQLRLYKNVKVVHVFGFHEGFKFPEHFLKDDSYLLQLFGDYLYQL